MVKIASPTLFARMMVTDGHVNIVVSRVVLQKVFSLWIA